MWLWQLIVQAKKPESSYAVLSETICESLTEMANRPPRAARRHGMKD